MSPDTFLNILVATIAAGTPLVYAALGELVVEKSGVLNLGVEGMMLVGAISGFISPALTPCQKPAALFLLYHAGCWQGV